MTRSSITRLADCAPVASPESWVMRKPPAVRQSYESDLEATLLKLEAIWRTNMARRDANAKKYGEPENPHEFYHGKKDNA